MALIFLGRTECPLCGKPVEQDQPLVATSHFIGSPDDPLWRYSDAAMHRDCFLSWELRPQFVARYNSVVSPLTWGNGTYHYMQEDGSILSLVRSSPPVV